MFARKHFQFSRAILATVTLALTLLSAPGVAWGGNAPPPPKALPYTNLTSTSITLNWQKYTGTADCLQIWRKPARKWYISADCLKTTVTSYTVKNLAPTKTYTFKVVAIYKGVMSDSTARWEGVKMGGVAATGSNGGKATVGVVSGNAGGYVVTILGPGGTSTCAIPSNATSCRFSALPAGSYSGTLALPSNALPSSDKAGEAAANLQFVIP